MSCVEDGLVRNSVWIASQMAGMQVSRVNKISRSSSLDYKHDIYASGTLRKQPQPSHCTNHNINEYEKNGRPKQEKLRWQTAQ